MSTQNEFDKAVACSVVDVMEHVWAEVKSLKDLMNSTDAACYGAIRAALVSELKKARPNVRDARTSAWRVRIMLHRSDDAYAEIHADTDPNKPMDEPGTTIIHGLPAVAEFVAEMAELAHPGRIVRGLDSATLAHSLLGFRPSLSRQGGDAIWRPRYTVQNAEASEPSATPSLRNLPSNMAAQPWVALVRVQKVTDA